MRYQTKWFKSMAIALRELEPFIKSGAHLETGKAFKNFGDLRPRELVVRFKSYRFARYSSAGERSALRRIWRVALQTRSRSADRTESPMRVSRKREYFGMRPETFG